MGTELPQGEALQLFLAEHGRLHGYVLVLFVGVGEGGEVGGGTSDECVCGCVCGCGTFGLGI